MDPNTALSIIPPDPDHLPQSQEEKTREDLFLDLLFVYQDPVVAARQAGYSITYSADIRTNKLKSKRFLAKVKERYLDEASLKLIGINKIEENVIDECVKDTGKVPKLTQFLKQIKQAAGVLSQDAPSAPTINIGELKAIVFKSIPDDI